MLKSAPWLKLSLTLSPEAAWERITTTSKPYGLLGFSGKERLLYKGTLDRFMLSPSTWDSQGIARHGHYWEITGRFVPTTSGSDLNFQLAESPKRYISAFLFIVTMAFLIYHYTLLRGTQSPADWLIADGNILLIFFPLLCLALLYPVKKESRRQRKLLLSTLQEIFEDAFIPGTPAVWDFFPTN